MRVLIAEDEFISAMALQDELESQGYEVCEIASKGQEVIDFCEIFNPDVILMDIMLSDKINGIDAAKMIHSKRYIPVIYLTASEDSTTLKRVEETKYISLITKPYNFKTLLVALDQLNNVAKS